MVRRSEERPDRTAMTGKPSLDSIPKLSADNSEDSQSDSGVSADFSYDGPAVQTRETPIEREIRRAVLREQSLRRSRGIKDVSFATEYVEIPLKKSVLYASLPGKTEQSQGKDRQIAGKKMQKEISVEVQREQALVELGTVPGVYDKGTAGQLRDRKQLFEAFQEPRDSPGHPAQGTGRPPSWASPAHDLSPREKASAPGSAPGGFPSGRSWSGDPLNDNQKVQRGGASPPWTRPAASTSPPAPRGPGLTEGNGYQVIILESNQLPLSMHAPRQNHRQGPPAQKQASNASLSVGRGDYPEEEVEEEEMVEEQEEEPLPKENPFFKLRSSLSVDKVEQDIREAQERERELRRQRSSLYGAAGAQRRERPRGERTANGGGGQPSPCTSASPPVHRPAPPPAQPVSPARRAARPTAARQQSLGRLGMWPPASQDEEKVVRLENPRASRQKTPLLQAWETGVVNMGHHDEDH